MRNVVIGFVGSTLDQGGKRGWRPSVKLCCHDGFFVERLELIHDPRHENIARGVQKAIAHQSPDTEVRLIPMKLDDPWDFQEVYGALFDFARGYGFDDDRERYFVHLTTGTHVAQICWFLLTESRHIPAQLVQTGPPRNDQQPHGTLDFIDLDLSRYNALQQRFDLVQREHDTLLKGGIETRDPDYNTLIQKMELITTRSDAPILLLGESGTGKTEMAQRIYEVKLHRRRVKGRLVQINCATLRGPQAQAALFGQRRAVTGIAGTERGGLLREADGGVLFLDEVDALGPDEQALLLHAIEAGRYYPVGSDSEVTSRFQIIAGANRPLGDLVAEGRLRPDLYARLNTWAFELPPLRARRVDMAAHIAHERARAEKRLGQSVGFNADAQARYLRFATDPATLWPGNFRDLAASILRLYTLAPRGRITLAMVEEEIATLNAQWRGAASDPDAALLASLLPECDGIDLFDQAQLASVIRICRASPSASAAGRALFAASRAAKTSQNDADRLRKYLARFGLDWAAVTAGVTAGDQSAPSPASDSRIYPAP